MTATLTHSPTDCTAKAAGICERIHVGDVVKVLGSRYTLGIGQSGNVTDISVLGAIRVNFPDGVANVEEFGCAPIDELHFLESELENMSA